MYRPAISVILPFFNAEATLNQAIESIARQTFGAFECILINNNSTDRSVQIAQQWAENDGRFRVIHETRQGVAFASNAGSASAKGKYIARMDADDWSYPDRLEAQYNFLEAHSDYGAVAGMVTYDTHDRHMEGFSQFVDWCNTVNSYEDICLKQFIEAPVINPSAMWRREIADRNGMYRSGKFPEDYDMWLRWLSEDVKIGKVPVNVIRWCDSPGRLTRTDPVYSIKSFYEVKSKYLVQWLAKNNPHHPDIYVWGASRISRRRAKMLEPYGVRIKAYIDIHRKRQLDLNVIYYQELPPPGEIFLLTYIKQQDARDEIQDFLHKKGFTEGKNYLVIS